MAKLKQPTAAKKSKATSPRRRHRDYSAENKAPAGKTRYYIDVDAEAAKALDALGKKLSSSRKGQTELVIADWFQSRWPELRREHRLRI